MQRGSVLVTLWLRFTQESHCKRSKTGLQGPISGANGKAKAWVLVILGGRGASLGQDGWEQVFTSMKDVHVSWSGGRKLKISTFRWIWKIISGEPERLMGRKQAVKTLEYMKGRLLKSVEIKTLEMIVHSHWKCVFFVERIQHWWIGWNQALMEMERCFLRIRWKHPFPSQAH